MCVRIACVERHESVVVWPLSRRRRVWVCACCGSLSALRPALAALAAVRCRPCPHLLSRGQWLSGVAACGLREGRAQASQCLLALAAARASMRAPVYAVCSGSMCVPVQRGTPARVMCRGGDLRARLRKCSDQCCVCARMSWRRSVRWAFRVSCVCRNNNGVAAAAAGRSRQQAPLSQAHRRLLSLRRIPLARALQSPSATSTSHQKQPHSSIFYPPFYSWIGRSVARIAAGRPGTLGLSSHHSKQSSFDNESSSSSDTHGNGNGNNDDTTMTSAAPPASTVDFDLADTVRAEQPQVQGKPIQGAFCLDSCARCMAKCADCRGALAALLCGPQTHIDLLLSEQPEARPACRGSATGSGRSSSAGSVASVGQKRSRAAAELPLVVPPEPLIPAAAAAVRRSSRQQSAKAAPAGMNGGSLAGAATAPASAGKGVGPASLCGSWPVTLTALPCALLPIDECDSEDEGCAAELASDEATGLAAPTQMQPRMLDRDDDEEEEAEDDAHGVGIDALPTARGKAAAPAASVPERQRSASEASAWSSGLAACAGSATATASSAAASQGFHTPQAPTPSGLSLTASDDDLFDASALPVCRDDSFNSLSMQRAPASSYRALSPVQLAAGGAAAVPATGDGCLGFTLRSGLGNAGAPLQLGGACGVLQPAALVASALLPPPAAGSGFGLQRCTSMGLQLSPTGPAVAASTVAAGAAAAECELLLPPLGALQLQSSNSFSALPPPLRPLALSGACSAATGGFLVPALLFTGEGQQAQAASFLRPLPSLTSPSLSGMPF